VSGRRQPSAAALRKEPVAMNSSRAAQPLQHLARVRVSGRLLRSAAALRREPVARNRPLAAQLRLPRIHANGRPPRSAHRRLVARRSATRSLRSGRRPHNDPLHLHNVLLRRRARPHLARLRSGSPRLSARPPRHPRRPGRQPVPHRVRPSGHPLISQDAKSGASARNAASLRRGRSGKRLRLLPNPLHRLSRYSLRLHHRPLAASNPQRRRLLRGHSPLHRPSRLPLSSPRSVGHRQCPHRPRHR
jgi:hypothetical protein